MSYLCAGLYAEGPTDYAFLLPLIDQLLPRLASALLPGVPIIADTIGIDAPGRPPAKRAERIAAAIDSHWRQCTIFVIHADGQGDPARAAEEQIDPAIALATSAHAELAVAACVPVREIEAWLLADDAPFRRLIGAGARPRLPADPEALLDPKRELRRLLRELGGPPLHTSIYQFIAAGLAIDALDRLPAFRAFEASLSRAIVAAARA